MPSIELLKACTVTGHSLTELSQKRPWPRKLFTLRWRLWALPWPRAQPGGCKTARLPPLLLARGPASADRPRLRRELPRVLVVQAHPALK